MAARPILNAGLQAGDIRIMKDFWLQLSMVCAAGLQASEQAAYNILLSLQPWSDITLFSMGEDGWGAQMGTQLSKSPHQLEPEPKWDGIYSTTSNWKRHVILHQYPRIPAWRQSVEQTYRSSDER
jgi:hypothetical protein